MEIRNVKHKGLKAFIERGQERGLPSQYIDKVRDIIGFLLEIDTIEEVLALKKYKPHRMTGDRAGQFTLSVTPNWRITFSFDAAANEIIDLDFEDYH
jgi:toxin HigB-1